MAEYRHNNVDRTVSVLKLNEQKAVSEFADRIRSELGTTVKDIILFGSRARGEGDEHSDLDIMIVIDGLSWDIKCRISDIAAEENIKHHVVISTVRYKCSDWNNPVIQGSPFAIAVNREGIRL